MKREKRPLGPGRSAGVTRAARVSWSITALLALGACGLPVSSSPPSSSTLEVRVTAGGTTTPAPGLHVYSVDAPVQVEAVPDRGWTFEGWSGDATGDTNPLRLVMDGDKELTARFVEAPGTHTLTVGVSGNGATAPAAGARAYAAGSRVQVTAIPARGATFSEWRGAATGRDNPVTVSMDEDREVTAVFTPETATSHALTVTVVGNGSTSPSAGAHAYPAGTTVEITAIPSPGATFSGWSGAASGNATRTTVTLDADKTVTATFTSSDGGFQPCPTDGTPCKVMPLGDSITHGYPTVGGYRNELFRLAGVGKKAMTFVGTKTDNGPATVDGRPFPLRHEGWGGYTITGIHNLVQGALTSQRPHVVLLMIGTNDINGRQDLPNAPNRLGLLLDRIITTSPDALVVVARIVPTTDDTLNAAVRTYNDGLAQAVQQRRDAGKHLLLVDMYGPFTANPRFKTELMADRLHPKAEGYAEMARIWYAAIERFLPAAP